VSRDDLVRFARRPWSVIAAAKDQHWLRRKRALSTADVWHLGAALRSHARTVRPEGPSLSDRVADVETHQRVGKALRAVTRAAR
jgi:hypothetical protein